MEPELVLALSVIGLILLALTTHTGRIIIAALVILAATLIAIFGGMVTP